MTAINQNIPEGYMVDKSGRLVPHELIKPRDRICNDLVQKLISDGRQLQQTLRQFKALAHQEIAAFVELSASDYQVQLGGKKGNVTLMSFDGRYKVQRSYQESIMFDERLAAAKELIDQCITRWTEGANRNIQKLVEHAFQTNQQGHVSTGRVLGLRRLDIDDDQWRAAMDAIGDAMQVIDSKSYVRLYERIGETDQWQAISLNIAEL